jgi:RNA 2',3'-cyclic 3'-phosphodiesterase
VTKGDARTGSVVGDERLRLFCALQLSDETVECITAWQRAHLQGGGRIVPPENLHITLAFLGSRPAAEVPAIVGALRDAARGAHVPQLDVVRYRETRSVGMLVMRELDDRHATAFADDLQERLEALGVFRREARPWHPHITVLRFRERAGLSPEPPNACSIDVVRSALYRSSPGRGSSDTSGARYDVLDTAALGGR